MAAKNGFVCAETLSKKLHEFFTTTLSERKPNFGNARFVRNTFEAVIKKQAARLLTAGKFDRETLQRLEPEDLN